MEQNKITIYNDYHNFEDMLLCAFRYAIGRHTYIVSETCDFFKENAHLISKRMFVIMLNDLDEQIRIYEKFEEKSMNVIMDLDTLYLFKNFLIEYGKGLDLSTEEGF